MLIDGERVGITPQEWVAALRSGEYHQTKEAMVDPYGYCCLGVGAVECGLDIQGDDFYEDRVTVELVTERNNSLRRWMQVENTQVPQPEYLELFGLKPEQYNRLVWYESNREYEPEVGWVPMKRSVIQYLAYMNDNGYSFEQIADWIEFNFC